MYKNVQSGLNKLDECRISTLAPIYKNKACTKWLKYSGNKLETLRETDRLGKEMPLSENQLCFIPKRSAMEAIFLLGLLI